MQDWVATAPTPYSIQKHPLVQNLSRRLFFSLAHRNRSDFCDLRLRCPSRTPEIARFLKQEKAMLHCDLRVRWKVASDLRFRAAISEPKTPSFCGISGDLAQSTRKSLAIAIVRFWCAKFFRAPKRGLEFVNENDPRIEKRCFSTKCLTSSSPQDWSPENQSSGQILDKLTVRGIL